MDPPKKLTCDKEKDEVKRILITGVERQNKNFTESPPKI